jgi:peptidoglycan/xylan/chitin deacetylase (PgdA/CDA1 family)
VFHDGYRDNYDVAYPILKEFSLKATFFLTTNFIGTGERFWVDLLDAAIKYTRREELHLVSKEDEAILPLQNNEQRYEAAVKLRWALKRLSSDIFWDYLDGILSDLGFKSREDVPHLGDHEHCMDWDMVREMAKGGMEFGSHTHRHIICARQDEATARQEMITSKALIEREIGKPCELFCYPNGYYPRDGNENTDRIASEVGYYHTLYMVGPYNLLHKDIFKITAIAYGEDSDIPELERTLSRYRYTLRKLKRSRIWPWEHDRLD